MPNFVDIAVDSILGLSANQGKTMKQSPGYSSETFRLKQVLEVWKGYATSPGGTQAGGDFVGLVSSPDITKTYRLTYNGNIIQYANGSGDVEFYYDNPTAKFKCGRPN